MNESDAPLPLSFEDALSRLEAIVAALEDGPIGLAEALARYESGISLLKHCHCLLERADRRIELLSGLGASGEPILEPFDDRKLSLDEKASTRASRRTRKPPATQVQEEKQDAMDDPRGLF